MIRLSWDETTRRLTLHERQGDYPGMSRSREFRIVIVDGLYDLSGLDGTSARTVLYEGNEMSIEL